MPDQMPRLAELEQPGSVPDVVARMARIPAFSWHVKARLILGVGTFFDAFDLLAISFALPAFIGTWHMNPGQIGGVLSAAFVGQLLGALLGGWFAERWGRLHVATMAIALFSVMSLACAFAWSPLSLIIIRLIQGVGLGAEVPVATTYITEIAQARGRGRFYILYELVFVFGLIAAGLLGTVLVPTLGWRSLFFLGATPALLSLVLLRLLPESPRWLALIGRSAEADAVVRGIEGAAARAGIVLPPPVPEIVTLSAARGDWREMFSPAYRRRTFSVWAIWFCCFSTSYGLVSWLPALYRTEFNLPLQQSLSYGLITQIVGIAGSFTCAMVVDRIGRRVWFTLGLACGGAILLALWAVGVRSAEMLLGFVSAGGFFISSVSIGLNLYTPELYPTRIRAFASSVGGAWQRVAAVIGPLVVGWLLPAYGIGPIFIYFGVLAIMGAVITWAFAIETAGRELEELSP